MTDSMVVILPVSLHIHDKKVSAATILTLIGRERVMRRFVPS